MYQRDYNHTQHSTAFDLAEDDNDDDNDAAIDDDDDDVDNDGNEIGVKLILFILIEPIK